MPLSTLIGGLVVMSVIATTWFICYQLLKFAQWASHIYKWNKQKRG